MPRSGPERFACGTIPVADQFFLETLVRLHRASERKDDNVDAGRAFVAAYVAYVYYVEGVHDAIVATGGHQH